MTRSPHPCRCRAVWVECAWEQVVAVGTPSARGHTPSLSSTPSPLRGGAWISKRFDWCEAGSVFHRHCRVDRVVSWYRRRHRLTSCRASRCCSLFLHWWLVGCRRIRLSVCTEGFLPILHPVFRQGHDLQPCLRYVSV